MLNRIIASGFPSPNGEIFLLMEVLIMKKMRFVEVFPSPYGVIFLLMQIQKLALAMRTYVFPSPNGEIFLLIGGWYMKSINVALGMFPSPNGEIFLLISTYPFKTKYYDFSVSVS